VFDPQILAFQVAGWQRFGWINTLHSCSITEADSWLCILVPKKWQYLGIALSTFLVGHFDKRLCFIPAVDVPQHIERIVHFSQVLFVDGIWYFCPHVFFIQVDIPIKELIKEYFCILIRGNIYGAKKCPRDLVDIANSDAETIKYILKNFTLQSVEMPLFRGKQGSNNHTA
jgi:hypothetical protein